MRIIQNTALLHNVKNGETMNSRIEILLRSFIPYIAMGISVVVFIGLLVIMSYILLWGLLLAFIFGAIAYIGQRIHRYRHPEEVSIIEILESHKTSVHTGRTFDHENNDPL